MEDRQNQMLFVEDQADPVEPLNHHLLPGPCRSFPLLASSGLSQKSSGDVSHVSFLEDIVDAIVLIDADEHKCLYNSFDIKSHVDKPVD